MQGNLLAKISGLENLINLDMLDLKNNKITETNDLEILNTFTNPQEIVQYCKDKKQ